MGLSVCLFSWKILQINITKINIIKQINTTHRLLAGWHSLAGQELTKSVCKAITQE